MTSPGQTELTGVTLTFFDAAGAALGGLTLPADVEHGEVGSTILLATHAFAELTGAQPDFDLPAGLLAPASGRVCFSDADCLAWGEFTDDNGTYGDPAPGFAPAETRSLQLGRRATPRVNALDYRLDAPTPTRNDGSAIELGGPTGCIFEETFATLDAWDELAPGAGLDLSSCGLDLRADVGSIAVEEGRLVLRPGERDDLGFGAPIALAGLSSEVTAEIPDQD